MNKRIFTPFPQMLAGTLATNLLYVGDKPDVDGKPKGRYQGFKKGEYVFSPKKNSETYVKDPLLSMLVDAEDQLYINAHCKRGIDYLSTKMSCTGGGKVTVEDLILQLKAHGLLEQTKCKIKLWVCEGALDDGPSESFAKRFSRDMFTANYKTCLIFAYSLSVFGKYSDGSDDPGVHKRAVKPGVVVAGNRLDRLKQLVPLLEDSSTPAPDKKWAMKVAVWKQALLSYSGDKQKAMDGILTDKVKGPMLLGDEHELDEVKAEPATVGGRAKTVRKQFSNGAVVG